MPVKNFEFDCIVASSSWKSQADKSWLPPHINTCNNGLFWNWLWARFWSEHLDTCQLMFRMTWSWKVLWLRGYWLRIREYLEEYIKSFLKRGVSKAISCQLVSSRGSRGWVVGRHGLVGVKWKWSLWSSFFQARVKASISLSELTQFFWLSLSFRDDYGKNSRSNEFSSQEQTESFCICVLYNFRHDW